MYDGEGAGGGGGGGETAKHFSLCLQKIPSKIEPKKQIHKNYGPKNKYIICVICAVLLNFLSSICSANFKIRVMSYRVIYFYLHSFNVIEKRIKNVAAMKIRSGNLALKVQILTKILLLISVLRTKPEYKREVLSRDLFVVRDLQHQQQHQ